MAKENRNVLLWTVLVALILAVAGVVTYLCWNKSTTDEKNEAENGLWLKIRTFEGEMRLDSLEKAISDYQWYFPHGRHAGEVRDMKERIGKERADWIQARYSDSIEEVADFIRNHSNSFFRHDADRLLDSLSFVEARMEDTYEAYETYLSSYSDGIYSKEARKRMDVIDSGVVTDNESVNAGNVINDHFVALATEDSEKLKSTVADVVTSYIGKVNATPADVDQYMRSIHSDKSRKVTFQIQNMVVSKQVAGHKPEYTVSFLLDEYIEQGSHTDDLCFMCMAKINHEGKITSLILSRR